MRLREGRVLSVVLESLDDSLDFFNVLDTVPEQALSSASEASISALEVPSTVLVVGASSPEQLPVVLLDGVENVVDNVVEDTVATREELGHDGDFAFGVRDDGNNVERLVSVDRVGSLLEVAENTSH